METTEEDVVRRTVPTPIQYQARNDFDLLMLARHGNTEAYDAFVARHERRVYALVAGITARPEDAAAAFHHAFVGGYRDLESWRGDETPRMWLLKRAVRAAFDRVHALHADPGAPSAIRATLREARRR